MRPTPVRGQLGVLVQEAVLVQKHQLVSSKRMRFSLPIVVIFGLVTGHFIVLTGHVACSQ